MKNVYIKLASYFELQASAPNDSNETSFQKQLQSKLYLQTNLYNKTRGAFFFFRDHEIFLKKRLYWRKIISVIEFLSKNR